MKKVVILFIQVLLFSQGAMANSPEDLKVCLGDWKSFSKENFIKAQLSLVNAFLNKDISLLKKFSDENTKVRSDKVYNFLELDQKQLNLLLNDKEILKSLHSAKKVLVQGKYFDCVGYRGIMFGNGEVWFGINEDYSVDLNSFNSSLKKLQREDTNNSCKISKPLKNNDQFQYDGKALQIRIQKDGFKFADSLIIDDLSKNKSLNLGGTIWGKDSLQFKYSKENEFEKLKPDVGVVRKDGIEDGWFNSTSNVGIGSKPSNLIIDSGTRIYSYDLKNRILSYCQNITENVSITTPSFDCSVNLSSIERTICNDRELSSLDLELNSLYTKVNKSKEDIREQRDWLRERDKNCSDSKDQRNCIASSYLQRIMVLKRYVPEIVNCIVTFKRKEIVSYGFNWDDKIFEKVSNVKGPFSCTLIGFNTDKYGLRRYLCEKDYWYDLGDIESYDSSRCLLKEY